MGLYLASDLSVGQDLEGRFITHRHEARSDPGNQLVGLVNEVRISRRTSGVVGPSEAEPSFIREVGPIRRYGPGGGWERGDGPDPSRRRTAPSIFTKTRRLWTAARPTWLTRGRPCKKSSAFRSGSFTSARGISSRWAGPPTSSRPETIPSARGVRGTTWRPSRRRNR